MEKRLYRLDRYLNGRLMAEGAAVYAYNEEEALEKAADLFRSDASLGEMECTRFEVRS